MLKQSAAALFKAVWKKSWTKFWGYCQMAGAAAWGGLSELNSFIQDPHFKDYLSNFEVPKWVLVSLATFGLITWLAHGREDDA